MAWKSSDEPWDDHPNKEWRITIQFARDHDWFWSPHQKAYGHLACQPNKNACGKVVFKTGANPERIAIQLRRQIERGCPHRED